MTKILDGIRIIDFTQGHTGSYGTMLLADFGAEVIKIEDHKKGGDVLRSSFPKNEKGSAYHAYMNRGKKSICIDRRSPQGQEMILRLIEKADVVCDGFPAGEMEACGIGYQDACNVNPNIIYASHTGFGKTGPLSNTSGCDLASEAICGLMETTGSPDGDPTAHGSRIADQFGGVFFAFSIVAALMARMEMGEGQQIDVASSDCMFTALEDCVAEAYMDGVTEHREGNGSRAIAPYDTFEVKDGILSTAVSTNSQWKKFCDAMGFDDIKDDPRFSTNELRGEHYYGKNGLRERIASKFETMTKWEIEDMLRPYNIPSGPGFTVPEAFENDQLQIRNMVLQVEDKTLGAVKMPGVPIKLSGIDDTDIGSAPLLGEDTKSFLQQAGYTDSEIETMEIDGVIMCKGGDRS
ncbi:MAG: CaiB/BaiF CoA-transferase family protein [Clostridiales Family XIII bacterium]|nr:CaiB/BaiF CoA-transferase family protein [Clostridiales Family XIII bacterium]